MKCYSTFIAILGFCTSHQLVAKQSESDQPIQLGCEFPEVRVRIGTEGSQSLTQHPVCADSIQWSRILSPICMASINLLPGVPHLRWFHPWRIPPMFSVQLWGSLLTIVPPLWKRKISWRLLLSVWNQLLAINWDDEENEEDGEDEEGAFL